MNKSCFHSGTLILYVLRKIFDLIVLDVNQIIDTYRSYCHWLFMERRSVNSRHSVRSAYLDSDHALTLLYLCLYLNGSNQFD